jgi:hypothetical protein
VPQAEGSEAQRSSQVLEGADPPEDDADPPGLQWEEDACARQGWQSVAMGPSGRSALGLRAPALPASARAEHGSWRHRTLARSSDGSGDAAD